MIQRIQTVYLLIAVLAMILPIFIPFAHLLNETTNDVIDINTFSAVNARGEVVEYMWPSFVLTIINILFTFVVILSFKKRIAQIRLATMDLLVYIGNCILTAVLAYLLSSNCEGYSFMATFVVTFPIFVIIAFFLAVRAIGADEALVRSADRLR